jgi:serine phosphatase RsbU (regulator of sigma subunit)
VAGLERELETARRIQESILPRRPPHIIGLNVASHYDSMAEVAGDFFDFVVTPSGRLGILVADVSGHGVPAAIVASMVKIALATQGNDVEDPGAVLTRMNRALYGRFELAYVTAVFALVDPRARTLAYASAGHPPPVLLRRDGLPESLAEGGLILGVMPEVDYTTTTIADIQVRDKLVLYTDGLTEAAGTGGEFFGDRRFHQFLTTRHAQTAERFTAELVDTAGRWTGGDFADDVTIVVAEYAEEATFRRSE